MDALESWRPLVAFAIDLWVVLSSPNAESESLLSVTTPFEGRSSRNNPLHKLPMQFQVVPLLDLRRYLQKPQMPEEDSEMSQQAKVPPNTAPQRMELLESIDCLVRQESRG